MNIKRIRDCIILGALFSIVFVASGSNLDPEELILVFCSCYIGMIAGNVLGYLITKMFSKKAN